MHQQDAGLRAEAELLVRRRALVDRAGLFVDDGAVRVERLVRRHVGAEDARERADLAVLHEGGCVVGLHNSACVSGDEREYASMVNPVPGRVLYRIVSAHRLAR